MSYFINPSAFKSIFAVPAEIVDKHIRLATEPQLKVLLWILRNSPDNPDLNALCADLKINPDDARDYLQYWLLTGVLLSDDSEPREKSPEKESRAQKKDEETPGRDPAPIPPPSLSSGEIAQRVEESPEIGVLLNEAQKKLGKTIPYYGQCVLLTLYDHYGLPLEVLFMLLDYCASIGKTNYAYIDAIGRDWGNREIDDLEKAAEQIDKLKGVAALWNKFARSAGISNPRPTKKQSEYLMRWSSDWKFDLDMIVSAYEETAERTGKLSFAYMEKVLLNWKNSGYSTLYDVQKGAEEKKKTRLSKKSGGSRAASYDMDEFKERSLHGELKYERKKRK